MRIIFLVLFLGLISCNNQTDFYILNESESKVQLQYSTKGIWEAEGFVRNPILVRYDSMLNFHEIKKVGDWTGFNSNPIVKVELNPNEALYIGSSFNFDFDDPKSIWGLKSNLDSLKIMKEGNMYLSSDSDGVVEHFNVIDDKLVGIEIN